MKRPFVLWLTGLSGSGKTTLAKSIKSKIKLDIIHLDGDIVRNGLCSDLGFSNEDRKENIRRISHVAKIFNDNDNHVLVSFITPQIQMREMAKDIIGKEHFVEIFVNCPLDVCEERDVKGLYKKARSGEINNFTGIHQEFENPVNPIIEVNTNKMDIDACTNKIFYYLFQNDLYDGIF